MLAPAALFPLFPEAGVARFSCVTQQRDLCGCSSIQPFLPSQTPCVTAKENEKQQTTSPWWKLLGAGERERDLASRLPLRDQKPEVESKTATSKNKPKPVWRIEEFTKLSMEARAKHLPFCVAENITLKQFHAKVEHMESGGCFHWEFKDGKAWIYELPHAAHEDTAGQVVSKIQHGLGAHFRGVNFAPSP